MMKAWMPPDSQPGWCSLDPIIYRPGAAAAVRESGLEQLADVHVGLFLGRELEQLRRLEIERAGDDGIGELLDADVVDVHRLVVELAPVGDGVFQAGDARLQLLERLVGLERSEEHTSELQSQSNLVCRLLL